MASNDCRLGSLFKYFLWAHSAKNAGKPKPRTCLASTYRALATRKVILIQRMGDGSKLNQGPPREIGNMKIGKRKEEKWASYKRSNGRGDSRT